MVLEGRALDATDLTGCVALSTEAGWNQTGDDWRLILDIGVGRGLYEGPRLVACAVVIPYGWRIGWICMVLVATYQRRRGHATKLMRWALDACEEMGLTPGLDATPDGKKVYEQLGFVDIFPLTRLRASSVVMPDEDDPGDIAIRPLGRSDLEVAAAFDADAFGADRTALVTALRAREPKLAFIASRKDRTEGFVLGRDGRIATQIGPLVATDETVARALLSSAFKAVKGPVFLDLADGHSTMRAWLEDAGFTPQRPFMRMLAGRDRPLGNPENIVAVAGPELA